MAMAKIDQLWTQLALVADCGSRLAHSVIHGPYSKDPAHIDGEKRLRVDVWRKAISQVVFVSEQEPIHLKDELCPICSRHLDEHANGIPITACNSASPMLNDVRRSLVCTAARLTYGCGNSGCQVRKPLGLATNGMCNCSPHKYSKDFLEMAASLEGKWRWE